MESWVQSIGTAPIASLVVVLCGVIVLMARHIVQQHERRIEDQRLHTKELRELIEMVSPAVSSAAAGMTSAAAAMTAAREAMQITTGVVERMGR